MNSKKWLATFLGTCIFVFALMLSFNALIDPFGVFGDPILNWYSYNFTSNPRVAKIAYMDRNHERFDSFIVGPSGASGIPVDMLNEHFDANFFNMFVFGADMQDTEQIARYLIDNFTVRNLVLNVYIDSSLVFDMQHENLNMNMHVNAAGGSGLSFFSRYLLLHPQYSIEKIRHFRRDMGFLPGPYNWFDMETGAYNKRGRAAEPIGCMEAYLVAYPIFADYPAGHRVMTQIENTVQSVTAIRDMSAAAGVNLLVIFSPVYSEHFARFSESDVVEFYTRLANVVEFWDFSMSTISFDPRFFYDATHFRHAVGVMALGRIFGYEDMFIPDDFGVLVTSENAAEHAAALFYVQPMAYEEYTAIVPILMYHHIEDDVRNDMIVTEETFAMHMRVLYEHGFNAIPLSRLVDFVDRGVPLPERPVVITFDDGYLSVYRYAFPVLARYGHHATSFVIGEAVGTDTYKDTGEPTIPKFCFEQAHNMAGVVSIQSHSYDMHQHAPFEIGRARTNILRWPDECVTEYIEILRADHMRVSELIYEGVGETVFSIAFPHGIYDTLSQAVLVDMGVRVTLGTHWGSNTIIMGLPQSLLSLNRFNINNDVTEEDLLAILTP